MASYRYRHGRAGPKNHPVFAFEESSLPAVPRESEQQDSSEVGQAHEDPFAPVATPELNAATLPEIPSRTSITSIQGFVEKFGISTLDTNEVEYHLPQMEFLEEYLGSKESYILKAPTNAGKTFISLMALSEALSTGGRVVFLTPKEVLTGQVLADARSVLEKSEAHPHGLEPAAFIRLVGDCKIGGDKRAAVYSDDSIRFIVATPELFRNDLDQSRIDLKKFHTIVLDEVHRAVGDYAMVSVAKDARAAGVRLLGLSASPARDTAGLSELMENLGFSKWYRLDVPERDRRHLPPRKVQLYPDMQNSILRLTAALYPVLARLVPKLKDIPERQLFAERLRSRMVRGAKLPLSWQSEEQHLKSIFRLGLDIDLSTDSRHPYQVQDLIKRISAKRSPLDFEQWLRTRLNLIDDLSQKASASYQLRWQFDDLIADTFRRLKMPSAGEIVELNAPIVLDPSHKARVKDPLRRLANTNVKYRDMFSLYCELNELRHLHSTLSTSSRYAFCEYVGQKVAAVSEENPAKKVSWYLKRIYRDSDVVEAFRIQAEGTPYIDLIKHGSNITGPDFFKEARAELVSSEYSDHPKEAALFSFLEEKFRQGIRGGVIIFIDLANHGSFLADRLSHHFTYIQPNIAEAIAGGSHMRPKDRQKRLARFAAQEARILIATSVAEEGLHVPKASILVNYSPTPLPISIEQRQGRVGRRARKESDDPALGEFAEILNLLTTGTPDISRFFAGRNRHRSMKEAFSFKKQSSPSPTLFGESLGNAGQNQ